MTGSSVLEPQSRAALTQLLQPPPGFSLAHAVGTTFTLSLDTALAVPLSFAARRMTADDDSLGILDAVRRAADRVDIFAQAGYVSIGLPPSDLVAFLEPMIHPIAMMSGIFHPKVWFLEFERDDERAYRFICASRNLTSDTTWDVVISLDGQIAEPEVQEECRETNAPLVELLTWLPGRSVHPLSRARSTRIADLAQRWATVAWDTPPDTRALRFHVWGAGNRPSPEFTGKRALIVSPFLSDEGVTALTHNVREITHLVSRPTSIDTLNPASIGTRKRTVSVLSEAASPESADDEQPGTAATGLTGLHAKTYVYDRHDGAHVFLGSLNATGSALSRNVEVMVEVVGTVNAFGVEATRTALGDFVEEYELAGAIEPSLDDKLDRDLSHVLARVGAIPLHVRVLDGNPHSLNFWRDENAPVPNDVDLSWRPLSRSDLVIPGLPGVPDSPSTLQDVTLAEITPFIVVTARDARGERSEQRTIVLARLHDDPEQRRDAIIAAHLTDRSAFIRFLMLLLELGGTLPTDGQGGSWGASTFGASAGAGLFEALMKAVGRGQSGLADVDRIVRMLAEQSESQALPPGFQELWSSIWSAHTRIEGERRG